MPQEDSPRDHRFGGDPSTDVPNSIRRSPPARTDSFHPEQVIPSLETT